MTPEQPLPDNAETLQKAEVKEGVLESAREKDAQIKCEHVVTSKEGTSYCNLAEESVKRMEEELMNARNMADALAGALMGEYPAQKALDKWAGELDLGVASNRNVFDRIKRGYFASPSPFSEEELNELSKTAARESFDMGEKIKSLKADLKASMEKQKELAEIGHRLKTQDNRITQNPMFCVQIKVRDVGYDSLYCDDRCWRDSANELTIYSDDKDFTEPPEGEEWDEFGYVDRWETVMVAFTEVGCERYLELNGHNDRSRAHNGQVRIYVESFNRCPEMIKIREYLLATAALSTSEGKGDKNE